MVITTPMHRPQRGDVEQARRTEHLEKLCRRHRAIQRLSAFFFGSVVMAPVASHKLTLLARSFCCVLKQSHAVRSGDDTRTSTFRRRIFQNSLKPLNVFRKEDSI